MMVKCLGLARLAISCGSFVDDRWALILIDSMLCARCVCLSLFTMVKAALVIYVMANTHNERAMGFMG